MTPDSKRHQSQFLRELEDQNHEMRATPMQLLLKNNLTIIDAVRLDGYGTSGVLELTDVKKWMQRPQDPMYDNVLEPTFSLVSVSRTLEHHLVAFHRTSPLTNLNAWVNLVRDKKVGSEEAVNLERLLGTNSSGSSLRSIMAGSELLVNNYLFDRKAVDEWLRVKDKPNRPYSVVEQITEANFKQKNYLKRNDRFLLSLGMQSFKNYIPFNIPITDIFKKRVAREGGQDGSQPEIGTLFHVQSLELAYPEFSIDPDAAP